MTLTDADVDFFDDDPSKAAVKYYAKRNELRPLLAASSKPKMLLVDFAELEDSLDELTALSLMLETLRDRDDWIPVSSSPSNIVHQAKKKRRRLNC